MRIQIAEGKSGPWQYNVQQALDSFPLFQVAGRSHSAVADRDWCLFAAVRLEHLRQPMLTFQGPEQPYLKSPGTHAKIWHY
jgi:hypothetical protein